MFSIIFEQKRYILNENDKFNRGKIDFWQVVTLIHPSLLVLVMPLLLLTAIILILIFRLADGTKNLCVSVV